jgi:hypothetical protein
VTNDEVWRYFENKEASWERDSMAWSSDFALLYCKQGREENPRRITFGLTDHYIAELALPAFIEALHLNVVGGLWLQMTDGVPVPVPWKVESQSYMMMLFAWPNTTIRLRQGHVSVPVLLTSTGGDMEGHTRGTHLHFHCPITVGRKYVGFLTEWSQVCHD